MIVDIHTHIGSWTNFYMTNDSYKKMLEMMDKLEIEKIICAHSLLLMGEFDEGEKICKKIYKLSGERIYFYTVYNPNLPKSCKIVEKELEKDYYVGIKIHPSFHRVFGNDKRYEPIWEISEKFKIPILTHSWEVSDYNPIQKYSFPLLFEDFLQRYKDAILILGHAGGRYSGCLASIEIGKKYKNVYVDISGDFYIYGLIEYLVNNLSSERVLFGSDMNWIDPRTHIGRVINAKITLKDKENIFRKNAYRIFRKLKE